MRNILVDETQSYNYSFQHGEISVKDIKGIQVITSTDISSKTQAEGTCFLKRIEKTEVFLAY